MKRRFSKVARVIAASMAVMTLFVMPVCAQTWVGWSGWLGNGETQVGRNVELDSDSISWVNWHQMEDITAMSVQFRIKTPSGNWVSDYLTLNSTEDLGVGKDRSVTSNCSKGNTYELYATVTTAVSSGILCGGSWEP